MDKIFIGFIAIIVVFTLGTIFSHEEPEPQPVITQPSPETIIPPPEVSAEPEEDNSSTTSSTTTTTLEEKTTTTTEIPWYVELEVWKVGRCLQTIRGKMNTLTASVSPENITGTWMTDPEPKFYYSCDGSELIPFEWAHFSGGKTIIAGNDVNATYRLAAKCGKNQQIEDLRDCEEVNIFLELEDIRITSINNVVIQSELIEEPTTTTTLKSNPYLDKFRGKGYRKADYEIAWMCPTCVPAVNRIVIEEPGVKSRSIGYGQEVNYVIYNPSTLGLERITRLLNAGGTATLIQDEEL
ncbi:hypothetical protein ACFLRC_02015 [Candidatus Altiarchaeota archaeon]